MYSFTTRAGIIRARQQPRTTSTRAEPRATSVCATGVRATILESDLAGVEGVEAEEGAEGFGAAGADESGEAEDFAAVKGEGGVLRAAFAGEVFEAEDGFADLVRDFGINFFEFAADHVVDDLVEVGAGHFAGSDGFAIAEDGVAVGDAFTFFEEMADVDDADAA